MKIYYFGVLFIQQTLSKSYGRSLFRKDVSILFKNIQHSFEVSQMVTVDH